MNYASGISTFASNLSLRQTNAALKQDLQITSRELSTGQRDLADITRSGEERALQKLDENLMMLERYQQASTKASARLDAMQSSLGFIRETSHNVTLGVLTALSANDANSIDIQTGQATKALEAVVSTLNKNVAGEALFSGAALDAASVGSAATIINDVSTIVNGAPDAATALAAVDFYFYNAAGGFEAGIYSGSTVDAGSLNISETTFVQFDVRADDQALRETMRNLAILAAVSNGSFSTMPLERDALMRDATSTGLNTDEALVTLQESVGAKEELVETQRTRNASEELAYAKTRSEIASVDLYEAASKLEEVQTQLQSMYHVTAKMSQLSLLNFLR